MLPSHPWKTCTLLHEATKDLVFRPASELPVVLVQCISINSTATKQVKLHRSAFPTNNNREIIPAIKHFCISFIFRAWVNWSWYILRQLCPRLWNPRTRWPPCSEIHCWQRAVSAVQSGRLWIRIGQQSCSLRFNSFYAGSQVCLKRFEISRILRWRFRMLKQFCAVLFQKRKVNVVLACFNGKRVSQKMYPKVF